MDHLVAGIDTVGDLLCFIIYTLSSPAQLLIQERLISSLFSKETENEKEKGEYLEAVIHEGLRLYSPIPMSQPRLVPLSGKTIDGYWIPGGMVVGSQGWSVHRLNADVWGEEEEVFKPERWLVDGNKDEDEDERRKQMERALFAFGRGGRGCTGKVLAMTEIRILLKKIYGSSEGFRTRLAKEMEGEKGEGEMQMHDQIISSRPRGQRCLIVFERGGG